MQLKYIKISKFKYAQELTSESSHFSNCLGEHAPKPPRKACFACPLSYLGPLNNWSSEPALMWSQPCKVLNTFHEMPLPCHNLTGLQQGYYNLEISILECRWQIVVPAVTNVANCDEILLLIIPVAVIKLKFLGIVYTNRMFNIYNKPFSYTSQGVLRRKKLWKILDTKHWSCKKSCKQTNTLLLTTVQWITKVIATL